jgi:hypothetical protein
MRGFADNVVATIGRIITRLRADVPLTTELGSADRLRAGRDLAKADAPVLQYTVIVDTKAETELPVSVLFSAFGLGAVQAYRIEGHVKRIFTPGQPLELSGIWFLIEYESGTSDADPATDINLRNFTFRFRRLREYEFPAPPEPAV